MQFPLVGDSYRSQSRLADNSFTMNWYVERMESPTATTPQTLYPCPGFSLAYTLPTAPERGMMTQNDRTFAVGGAVAYETTGGVPVALGTMATDTNPATIATNGPQGHQVMFTSGGLVYIYDLNSAAFGPVSSGATYAGFGVFLHSYFVVLDTTTATIRTSAPVDGTTWSGAAQRDTAGDKWKAMIVSHGKLWLLGGQRSDVWEVVAGSFAFAPADGDLIEVGISAPYSLVEVDNAPIWLGANETGVGMVWRGNGYSATRISDHALEFAIQSYSTISDAVAWTYQDQGHTFYVLNFPTAGHTWVWDAATTKWHQRGDWLSSAMDFTAYRPQYHVFDGTTHYVGDRTSGAIYSMSIAHQTGVDGAYIRRVRRSPTLIGEMRRLFIPQVQIHLETGLGTQTGQGADPLVMLRQSVNGGQTWLDERTASAGRVGQYDTSVIFRRCAAGYQQQFELSTTDPVPFRIVNAFAEVIQGAS